MEGNNNGEVIKKENPVVAFLNNHPKTKKVVKVVVCVAGAGALVAAGFLAAGAIGEKDGLERQKLPDSENGIDVNSEELKTE